MWKLSLAQSDVALALVEELESPSFGKPLDLPLLGELWMAHLNARGYIWLGDPACRQGWGA